MATPIQNNTETLQRILQAVNDLPEESPGVTVQETNGTLTTNSRGTATVSLGFKPDLVWLSVNHTWEDFSFEAAAAFYCSNYDKIVCADCYDDDEKLVALYIVERTETGFNIEGNYRDYEYGEGILTNTTISYSAVKFT